MTQVCRLLDAEDRGAEGQPLLSVNLVLSRVCHAGNITEETKVMRENVDENCIHEIILSLLEIVKAVLLVKAVICFLLRY